MNKKENPDFLHEMPDYFATMICSSKKIQAAWDSLTILARNEWICWVSSAKKEETKHMRLDRAKSELLDGKRRPCCWPGCPHRSSKAKKWFEKKKNAS